MKVEPATAKFEALHGGKGYFFCSAGCLTKFRANPERVLSSVPTPMGSGFVSLGTQGIGSAPAKPAASDRSATSGARIYVCPMCAEVRQEGPGLVQSAEWRSKRSRRCCLRLRRNGLAQCTRRSSGRGRGSCPICGMALEPRTVTLGEEENPELRDMTRRFWVSTVLTVPLAGDRHGEHAFAACFHVDAVELGATLAGTLAGNAGGAVGWMAIFSAGMGLRR